MRKWPLAIAGALLFAGGFGAALLLNEYGTSEIAVAELSTEEIAEAENEVRLLLDGKPIEGQTLLKSHMENPNKFNIEYSKGSYRVSGRIAGIGEVSTLNTISGFNVPLDMGGDVFAGALMSDETKRETAPSPTEVSIWLLDVDQNRASAFKKRQQIVVSCEAVRVINSDLTFDNCKEIKS